jgi:hypothetical protein
MRKAVSVILLPFILVSQSMCFGHAHVGSRSLEPVGHGDRPHIHLHGTAHHHHSHGTHHSHSHDSDYRSNDETTPQLISCNGHDDDCFYLSTCVASMVGRDSTSYEMAASLLNTDMSGPFIRRDVVPKDVRNLSGEIPQHQCARSFIVLRTLSLRI